MLLPSKIRAVGLMMFLGLFVTSNVQAHYDVLPGIFNNKIVTGGRDDTGIDPPEPSLKVFGYDFGEITGDPYNIGDPGFNTNGASTFAGGSTLQFNAQSYQTRFLSYWDGTGSPNFGAVPTGVSLRIGSSTRNVTFTQASAVYTAGTPYDIGNFGVNGSIHAHIPTSIFFNSLQTADSVPEGLYAIAFSLSNPGTGVANSDTLYIVYNNGLTEVQHDAGITFLEATAVPEPSTMALAAVGVLGCFCFYRKKRNAA